MWPTRPGDIFSQFSLVSKAIERAQEARSMIWYPTCKTTCITSARNCLSHTTAFELAWTLSWTSRLFATVTTESCTFAPNWYVKTFTSEGNPNGLEMKQNWNFKHRHGHMIDIGIIIHINIKNSSSNRFGQRHENQPMERTWNREWKMTTINMSNCRQTSIHNSIMNVRTWRAQLSSNTHPHSATRQSLWEVATKTLSWPLQGQPRVAICMLKRAPDRIPTYHSGKMVKAKGALFESNSRVSLPKFRDPHNQVKTFAIDCSCPVGWPPNHDDWSGKTLCNVGTPFPQLSASSGNSQDDVSSLFRLLLQPSVSKKSTFDICLSSPRSVHITTSIVSSKIIALAHPCHHKKQNTKDPRPPKPSQAATRQARKADHTQARPSKHKTNNNTTTAPTAAAPPTHARRPQAPTRPTPNLTNTPPPSARRDHTNQARPRTRLQKKTPLPLSHHLFGEHAPCSCWFRVTLTRPRPWRPRALASRRYRWPISVLRAAPAPESGVCIQAKSASQTDGFIRKPRVPQNLIPLTLGLQGPFWSQDTSQVVGFENTPASIWHVWLATKVWFWLMSKPSKTTQKPQDRKDAVGSVATPDLKLVRWTHCHYHDRTGRSDTTKVEFVGWLTWTLPGELHLIHRALVVLARNNIGNSIPHLNTNFTASVGETSPSLGVSPRPKYVHLRTTCDLGVFRHQLVLEKCERNKTDFFKGPLPMKPHMLVQIPCVLVRLRTLRLVSQCLAPLVLHEYKMSWTCRSQRLLRFRPNERLAF